MAQLSDDCFAFGGTMLRLDAALDDLAARLDVAVGAETIGIDTALGRITAGAVYARLGVPGFDNAAVDGYAVRFADLAPAAATRLPVSQRITAGDRGTDILAPGSAIRIFTGAPIPHGADTIFMQEDARRDGDWVTLPPGLKPGANYRLAGEDFAPGAPLFPAGTRLGPHHLAALAATGAREVRVRLRLRVGLFSTGDEVLDSAALPAGSPLPRGALIDSNRPMLAALLALRGITVIDLGILPDETARIARAIEAAAERCDAILTSGGVSTGEADHVKAAVNSVGRLDFWRLAIKPGRPIAMGTIAGKPFLGVPGNPAAVFVTFARFVGPVLDMLAGAAPNRPFPMTALAGFRYAKKPDRREYIRAKLVQAPGTIIAQRFAKDGAALISSLIRSDGLVELIEDRTEVVPGDAVPFYSYSALMA